MVQAALAYLSRAALSDAFQVDVEYGRSTAKVRAFPYTQQQAEALCAFIKAFIWTDTDCQKLPFAGWTVTCTIKQEESK